MSEFLGHPVIAVALLLGLLVFVHELGHYLVGKWSGIAVETFSIGFGPKILAFTRGETNYRLSLIPLGGYVKFYGASRSEDVPEALRGREFYNAPAGKRALTIAAGPVANFMLAFLVYYALGLKGIHYPPAYVGDILPDSPAEKAGLMTGDRVLKIGQDNIKNWYDLEGALSRLPGKEVEVQILRGTEPKTVRLTPAAKDAIDILGRTKKVGRAGVALATAPAVVTLFPNDGRLGKLGLKTGEKITSLSFLSQTIQIKGYRQWLDEILNLVRLNVAKVDLHLADRTVSLDLSGLPKENITIPGIEKFLGVQSSQLTLDTQIDLGLAQIQRGDIIAEFENAPVHHIFELQEAITKNKKPEVDLTIIRNDVKKHLLLKLQPVDVQKPQGAEVFYAFKAKFMAESVDPEFIVEKYNVITGLWFSARETAKQIGGITYTVGQLFAGQMPLKSLGGPILIAKVASDSVKAGLQAFMASAALISINLGVVNLVPIPALDGGQLLMILYEKIRRRSVSERFLENYQKIGFALILSLVFIAMYNDVSRFWKAIFTSVQGSLQ